MVPIMYVGLLVVLGWVTLLARADAAREECLRPVDLPGGAYLPGIGRWSSSEGRRWRVGREGTPVLTVVPEDGSVEGGSSSLVDEIVRDGARRMLAAALEAEVDAYLAEFAGERDEAGRRLVVRNGHARPRQVTTAAGAVEVVAPR